MLTFLKVAALAAMATMASASGGNHLLVSTTSGDVNGHINSVGIREWLGIRFGDAPVGEGRFSSPKPATPYSGVFEADFWAPGCPQVCNLPPGNCPAFGQSEDCLFLNVFSPTLPSKDPNGYPVFFWIHGGAFEQGLGTSALYNGSTMAQKDVVTVAINYRLGLLGFLGGRTMEGNYGLSDQRLALQWVIDNIKGFGGNPQQITIGGQSAGAMSVGAHMVSTASKGMFQGAIMESNPLGLPFHSRESAASNADSVYEYLNCAIDDVACLRSKSIDEILDAQKHAVSLDLDTLLLNFLPFCPMVDPDSDLAEQPLVAFANGEISNQVPLLQGSVLDEGQLFVNELFTKPLSEMAYKLVVDGVFGIKNSRQILKKYPFDIVEGSDDGRDALNVLATDLLFYCPLRNITNGYQDVLGVEAIPTYTYRFDHVLSFDCWGPDYAFCPGYVCHGSELPFVFNVFTDGIDVEYTPTAEEVTLTTDISNAWRNFITNGNPNKGLSIPQHYPPYHAKVDAIVVLDEPGMDIVNHSRFQYCNMWDRLGYFY